MREFEQSDLDMVNAWFRNRGLPEVALSLLPAFGLIEPHVACGFSYDMPVGISIISSYISNPDQPPKFRYKALVSIAEGLFDHQLSVGSKQCIFYSEYSNIQGWGLAHGFKQVSPNLYLKAFTKETL